MALPWTMWVVSSITLAVSAVSLPTMSNQLDTSLVYEDEYITGTQIFDGYARNVSLLYKNCTFDTGSDYGISFVHTSGFSPANEDIQNTTIVFDHCTFVTSVAAVYASRAHISLLHIEFVSSQLLGDNESSDPCVDIEIGAIQAEYMNNSLFDLRDLSIVMTNASLTSAAPVAYISTNSSLIPSVPVSFIDVSFLAQDSFLNPNFDLINSDFSIVNVTLLRVTLISNRLLGTSSGCNNITVTVIDSNITETFDTIVRVRPGRHQLFHFHNSNLTLSDQRYFNDSGSVFTFVSGVDVYGCAAVANHQLLCEGWDYSVSPTSSVITPCSYERFISDYPCSGHSFHTCNTAVGSCTASAAFNTTIVGQLLLSSQGGFASTLLNASRLGGDCSLQSFRLILQADESDVLRPSLPPAQVGFVVCMQLVATTIVGQLLLSSPGGFASTLLNASRLGGDCSLHSFRLILQADESDVLRPSLPPAQVGFVVCNATGCSPEQVRRGTCAPCPLSTTLASWNVNVTAQGNLFSLVNEEIFSNLDSTTVITLFIEAQDGSDAFDGIDIMVQLQASCYGACLAPCTTRDDIEFRFTGTTFLNVQHVENTERVLTHVQGASNVRFVFDGATIYGGLPIWVDDSVIGNVSVTATSASLNFVDDSFVQVSSLARTPHGVVNVDMSDSTLRLELSGTTLIPGTSPVSSVVQWNHQGDDAVFQMSLVRVEVLVSDLPSPLIGDKATFSLLSTQHTDLIWKQSVTLTMRQSSLVDAGSIGNINPAGVTVVCFNDSSISFFFRIERSVRF
ncbi:Hypothetical protein, putative [Bodo saltans]|uniref:Membrane-associated protein n=1 Tax=Bodo saltans TaxID=75058 RepID=A0A0S4KEM3_BODSA|nr:Hypothetical protein, putative [Bodo saltans]|eukprot:CUI14144.1 Hypothetical protein, putative [Bodo saltans]